MMQPWRKRCLAMILTLCLCMAMLPTVFATEMGHPMTAEELEVLKIMNQEREKEGLPPLTSLPELQDATDTRAAELAELFSHDRPDGRPWKTVFDEIDLPTYRTAGENIAAGYGNPEAVMVGWMNSAGHRSNILGAAYTHVGVGHHYQSGSDYRNYWTQLFYTDWDCAYTSMTLSRSSDKPVSPGTTVDELGLVACLQCKNCGSAYLPVLESYCTGYDTSRPETQILTVNCLGQTATIEIPVVPPTVVEGIKILHSLELASDISVNYAVAEDQLADYDSYYLECTLPVFEGNEATGTKTLRIKPSLKDGYYYFTLRDLTAVQIGDEILSTLYMEKAGDHFASSTDCYSIATYAYNQLKKEEISEKLKVLCGDLLVYGSSAQIFKGYRTDALADAALTEDQRVYCSDLSTVTFGNNNTVLNDVENAPITWAGKALNLESRVSLKFVMNASGYSGDPENLTLRVSYRNQDGVNCTSFVLGATPYGTEGCYAFEFDDLLASELRTVLSVCVMNGSEKLTPTLRYSADSYGNGRTGNLLTLCKALFAYSDSARLYFNAY